jgi:hypothetical protein
MVEAPLTQQFEPTAPHGTQVPLLQTIPAAQLAVSVLHAAAPSPPWQPSQPARMTMHNIRSPRRGEFIFTMKVLA